MESQSRESVKGTNGLLTANLFSMHDPAKKYMGESQKSGICISPCKPPTSPELMHGLHVLCQISPVVNNGEVLLSGNTQKNNFVSPQRELNP